MVDFIDRYLFKVLTVLGLVLLVATLGSFVASLPPRQFTILTGREGGGNYQAALAYQEIARENGFEIDIRTTAGSAEVLQRLKDGEASIGFVQGGIARGADRRVLSSLASVYYEPVWVFYRRDAFDAGGLKHLTDVAGNASPSARRAAGRTSWPSNCWRQTGSTKTMPRWRRWE